ncbi:hypothetical protein FRB99_007730, partial [Tulasnella sp. 403]
IWVRFHEGETDTPQLTLFGSTNLNSRSANLDTELSFLMATSSATLSKALGHEVENIREYAKKVGRETWSGAERRPAQPTTNAPMAYGNEKGGRGFMTGFTFGGWFRLHIPDLITMLFMGMIGLGVYFAKPAPTRNFPITFSNGEIVYPQYAYPLRKEIVPIWLSALLSFIIPFVFFCIAQIRRRNFGDFLCTLMGLLQSLITAAVFQVFLKWLIGGFRPHFLDVCKPNVTGPGQGTGFQQIMYTRAVCTGDQKQINDSLESFPSGHSTAAFAGFVYLSLYFYAQLKVNSDHRPAYWKIVLFFAPLLGATLIAGALTIDKFHHWYDTFAGAVIGTLSAIVCYRATFASILDFRFNHIVLPRSYSLLARNHPPQKFGYSPADITDQLPFTREGGWGQFHGFTGAPFDASALGATQGMGMGMGAPGYGTGNAGAFPHGAGGAPRNVV